MSFFELFVKLTHPAKRIGWEETTAYFTGDRRIPHRGRGGKYPVMNIPSVKEIHEYGIRYYAGDREINGWYIFYPSPEPAPEDIRGQSIRIRYKRRRPWIFENISWIEE